MKYDEFFQKLMDRSNLPVTPDTVRDIAFEETHRMLLVVIPKTLIKRILPSPDNTTLEKELKSE